jgi:hypothetical protein
LVQITELIVRARRAPYRLFCAGALYPDSPLAGQTRTDLCSVRTDI